MNHSTEKQTRINVISKPRQLPTQHKPNRSSVYERLNELHEKNSKAKDKDLPERIQALAQPKLLPTQFVMDRPSASWSVSNSAKNYNMSQRIETLAQPKQLPSNFQLDRYNISVAESALKYGQASARIEQLAQPKKPFTVRPWSAVYESQQPTKKRKKRRVSITDYECSDRILELSKPKRLHPKFLTDRVHIDTVSMAATKAHASVRIQQLAKSKVYHINHEDHSLKVSKRALNAECSLRIEELAKPVSRRLTSRKGTFRSLLEEASLS
ncbi:Testicular haploid expressed gene protein-like [Trichoplax sp. H2]|nr:Testicular haploid expressed gene protein-like [Trichoplax sp. H2]|eukprot:RDD36778.1 Testicular haploid expressed gene protein-like [Trichoplax sp. H2]